MVLVSCSHSIVSYTKQWVLVSRFHHIVYTVYQVGLLVFISHAVVCAESSEECIFLAFQLHGRHVKGFWVQLSG